MPIYPVKLVFEVHLNRFSGVLMQKKKVEKFSMARCVLCCRRLSDIYETQFRRNYYESDATTSALDQNIDGFQGKCWNLFSDKYSDILILGKNSNFWLLSLMIVGTLRNSINYFSV